MPGSPTDGAAPSEAIETGPRLARLAGLAAPAVAIASILLATLRSPTFTWTDSALSDLGVTPESAPLFNGGLVVGAVLALPLAWWLWPWIGLPASSGSRAGVLARFRAVLFGLAAALLGGVGLFPSGTALHFPVAVGFFLAAAATMIVDGLAQRGRRRWASVAAGVGSIAVWPAWAVLGLGPGIAVPEFVGAVLFGVWIWTLSPARVLRSAAP